MCSLLHYKRKLHFLGLLPKVLGVAHDRQGVDGEVKLVAREAPPAAGPVLRPEDGQVCHGKVTDAAKHLPVAVRRPVTLTVKQPPGPPEAARVLSVARQVLHRRLLLKTDTVKSG